MHHSVQIIQNRVVVTYYGIRKLHTNILQISLSPLDILLGRNSHSQIPTFPVPRSISVLLGRVAPSGPSETKKRHSAEIPSHAESDSHYQLRLFLFLFTAAINHTVTGSQEEREGELGVGGGGLWRGERGRKQFSSKRISYPNK